MEDLQRWLLYLSILYKISTCDVPKIFNLEQKKNHYFYEIAHKAGYLIIYILLNVHSVSNVSQMFKYFTVYN